MKLGQCGRGIVYGSQETWKMRRGEGEFNLELENKK